MWKPVIPLAAACLLLAAGFVFDHKSSSPVVNPSPAVVSASEAEQVEKALDDLQLLRQLDAGPATGASESM
jgi:hypothetical protein